MTPPLYHCQALTGGQPSRAIENNMALKHQLWRAEYKYAKTPHKKMRLISPSSWNISAAATSRQWPSCILCPECHYHLWKTFKDNSEVDISWEITKYYSEENECHHIIWWRSNNSSLMSSSLWISIIISFIIIKKKWFHDELTSSPA